MTISPLLQQSAPPLSAETTIYTVPTGMMVQANLFITNTSGTAGKVRFSIGGSANANKILFDDPLSVNETKNITGLVLPAGTIVSAYTTVAATFTLTGLVTTL
jgi:hypothetical protein